MKFSRRDCTCGRRHNLLAVVLAVIAIVLAGSGTAVAVTMTTVNIADPTTPSRIAKVDPAGRLNTVGAAGTLALSGTLQTAYQQNYLTSPTKATIAVSRIMLTNPKANAGNTTSETEVFLRKITVGGDGTCASGNTAATYAIYTLEPGDDITDTFPAPLTVAATGGVAYCLSLYVIPTNSDGTIHYYQYYSFTGFVAAGNYAGIGAGAPASGAVAAQPKAR